MLRMFAHRAGSVENFGCTIAAAMRAFALGLNIEFDVRACKNALVCTHYDKLGTDGLKGYPLEKVREFRLHRANGLVTPVHDPMLVDGGQADRIPSLLEILTLAKHAPTKPTILLDIKEVGLHDEIRRQVSWADVSEQIIYGLHQPAELEDWSNYLNQSLAFCSQGDLATFDDSGIAWIRLWEDWLTDEFGQLTDPHELLEHIIDHRLCVMTGGGNLAEGGITTIGRIGCMREQFNAEAFIVNDPAICLAAQYAAE